MPEETEIGAIFLDRDGVINRKRAEGNYVTCWAEFEFLPGALEGLKILAAIARRVIVVTNQRGIARGLFTEENLAAVHLRMRAEIQEAGGRIDAIYYCPHEEGACQCRKPLTGLFERARQDFCDIDWQRAVIVGDSLCDLEAAHRLGLPGVLVADGKQRVRVLADAERRGVPVRCSVGSLLEFSLAKPFHLSCKEKANTNR